MESQIALQWDMYGADVTVMFKAHKVDSGFEVVVSRDDEVVLTSPVGDLSRLLQQSQALREELRTLGFAERERAENASNLQGGLCWGPAAPVPAAILSALLTGQVSAPALALIAA